MANKFPYDSLWDDENFTVQRGVIPAKATLSGEKIGRGIIYYPVGANLIHRSPYLNLNIETLLPDGARKIMPIWNPGTADEIENYSSHPTDFFRVSLKFDPEMMNDLSQEEIGPATSLLLHGNWDERFKSTVQADLDAIHRIVPLPGVSDNPSPEDLELASLAKEDLELKLGWLSDQARRLKVPMLSFQIPGFGKASAPSPPNGLISVTVRTKDANGGPDVMNCTVWANFGGYNNTANAISFANVSSPTTDNLGVAIYNLWAEKGGQAGPWHRVKIGRSSSSPNSQTVDVFAP
jgi:hypothetical protein